MCRMTWLVIAFPNVVIQRCLHFAQYRHPTSDVSPIASCYQLHFRVCHVFFNVSTRDEAACIGLIELVL